MKSKKCPYCGKRAGYIALFSSRRKGEHICKSCGKESKVVINKAVYIVFLVALVVALAIMIGWISAGLISNPLGIVLVAIPMVLLTLVSPAFVGYEPLKKYRKSMEAKKAGKEYSDSFNLGEVNKIEWTGSIPKVDDSDSFSLNSDLFNSIRAEKNAERARRKDSALLPVSEDVEQPQTDAYDDYEQEMVPVINAVSENHASTGDVPLRKIHHAQGGATVAKGRHYFEIDEQESEDNSDDYDFDTKNYNGNRRF